MLLPFYILPMSSLLTCFSSPIMPPSPYLYNSRPSCSLSTCALPFSLVFQNRLVTILLNPMFYPFCALPSTVTVHYAFFNCMLCFSLLCPFHPVPALSVLYDPMFSIMCLLGLICCILHSIIPCSPRPSKCDCS